MEVTRRIDDVLHDAVGVDHVGHPRSDPALFVENAPGLAGLAPGEVSQQRELKPEFDRVGPVGEW